MTFCDASTGQRCDYKRNVGKHLVKCNYPGDCISKITKQQMKSKIDQAEPDGE